MATTLGSLLLLLSATAAGGSHYSELDGISTGPAPYYKALAYSMDGGGLIVADGPGNGYGFPNGQPDGYGWVEYGTALPLGANRVPDYFFPRYLAVPPDQLFISTYYNPYSTRGQRYLAYAGCGGEHPAGGPAMVDGSTPIHPYQATIGDRPLRPVAPFSGRVEATPINPGQSGLRP